MKKSIISLAFILIIFSLTISYSKEDPLKSEPNIELNSNFNSIDIENKLDSILAGHEEIVPNMDTIGGNSPRAKLVNRCIFVWNNMNRTKYVFDKDKIINDTTGVYEFDCSGFAGQIILKKALPNHYADIVNHAKKIIGIHGDSMNFARPLVANFYDYFRDEILVNPNNIVAENNYWKVFTSIDSLKRGDLIVVRYADSWRQEKRNSTTGHIMIAWEIGKVNSDHVVEIQVMDLARSAHTATADTRTMNSHPIAEKLNGKNSGIGFGKMKFLIGTNRQKRPYAYKWGLNSKSWYNLVEGDSISEPNPDKYDRIKGIIFARPK